MTVVAILLFVLFSNTSNTFLSVGNVIDIGRAMAWIAVVGVGMTFLFIAGEFDLSLGAIFGFSGIVLAYSTTQGITPLYATIIATLVALLIGLINGIAVTRGAVPSFIVTVGMLSVLQGASLFVSGGFAITMPEQYREGVLHGLAGGRVLGVPSQLWWAAGILIVTGIVLRKTTIGYHLYLTGGNEQATLRIGLNVARIKTLTFVFAAGLAGLAGSLQVLWLQSAQPTTGFGNFLFLVAGAAIIGGVSLNGGEGSVYGTFIGAVILATLTNGLALSGVNPGLGVLLTGVLIIAGGAVNSGLREALRSLVARRRTQAFERMRRDTQRGGA